MVRILLLILAALIGTVAHAEFRAINDPSDGWLNIRTGPGAGFEIIERLDNGTSVEVVGREGNWIEVTYGFGVQDWGFGGRGWVYRPYTLPEADFLSAHRGRYDIASLARLGRFCFQPYLGHASGPGALGGDLCLGTFYCGDGGCNPIGITVTVRSGRESEFIGFSQSLQFTALENASTSDGTSYYISSMPGYEIENVLRLRARPDIVQGARRTGGEAGAPPRMITISQTQFQRFRGPGIADLRAEVIDALEEALGRPCRTDEFMTCSVLPLAGRLAIDLLAPGTALTGRPDHWERSYWEVHVHWDGSPDEYLLYVALPVTSVRRWPVDGGKPAGTFESLDYDPGFEALRSVVMESVAFSVGGETTGGP